MAYYTGFVAAVPTANKDAYADHARSSWPMFKSRGALRMVECWGEDVTHGHTTDFYRATQAREDETPVFSWVEWPDRATCDAAWASMMDDPQMQQMGEMPFDGARMFWGGFSPVMQHGASRPGSYVQGFVLPARSDAKQAYVDMANSAAPMFERFGARHQVECWGEDVPHGKQTDFYRATQATEDETPVFAWIEWADRAACDEAARKMQEEMGDMPMPDPMPFDGRRMFWGGFTPIVDLS
ncbi:DUF1428 domain-containing protein [Paracoccus spongiarum]|uniref:DUF1428 domain-containing protein n=1 Tax=Paracoccus spongiarum TaxID=3064387 RepID=A0ABT9JGL5_9RHOB|nr:DUF1428 domain-containing protein [Paracoccus sp. 2205BS29-5]MDP5308855.1 DUF1428 domain-containing protein [Paracoccus sp. 2205BS29-5]